MYFKKKGLGIAARQLVLTLGVCASGVLATGSAFAQSTSGSVYGTVPSGAGQSVVVTSAATGLKRTVELDDDGRFNFSSLPPDTYTVELVSGGSVVSSRQAVVNAGSGTVISFSDSGAVELTQVTVFGSSISPIDPQSTHASTYYSAELLRSLPVAQDVTNVALLAPGTVKGDSAFGNLASFGGASVAENAYYINGFDVTNLFKNLNYSEVPWYGIGGIEIQNGGYGAQYGLSTGGVVSVTTKKGTNTWMGGASAEWIPESTYSHSPTTYTSDGQLFRSYKNNEYSQSTYGVWAGGPIIKDKLFIFGVGQLTKTQKLSYPNSYDGGQTYDYDVDSPYWLVKGDWVISDRDLLEVTAFSDETKTDTDTYSTAYDDLGFPEKSDLAGTDHSKDGGTTFIVKLTNQLTDSLTLSQQYGKLKSKRSVYQTTPDGVRISYDGEVGNFDQPGCPYVALSSTYTGPTVNRCYVTSTIDAEGGGDERQAGRVDLEYRADAGVFGTHTVKGGMEVSKWNSMAGSSYSGGAYYAYYTSATYGDYVRVLHFQTGADIEVDTSAYYLQDEWQLTDRVTLNLGIRDDSFKNKNGSGEVYVRQDDIIEPRLGFAWDISGDATKKLYGSYGIYSLPITATVAVRGASASIYDQQYFLLDGVESDGTAVLGDPLTDLTYLNAEAGQTPDPSAVASKNLDPTIQNEYILGYQMEIGQGWMAGVRGTFRDLDKTIDDMCDWRPLRWYADQNGLDYNPGELTPGCFMINPGSSLELDVDVDGDGTAENVVVPADVVGLPKAERKYLAWEFTLEKTFSKQLYMQASYTWAHNWGNTEGLVKSDIGQADTGTTQDFDYPEQMVGASGNLPNDRRHTLKMIARYSPTDELTFSASGLIQSGRPRNCLGLSPDDATVDLYGYGDPSYYGGYGNGAYFYCNGVVTPRGSAGTTDTVFNLDLSASYSPSYVKGLSVQASVFNVFNGDAVTSTYDYGEAGTDYDDLQPEPAYGAATSYQTPRYLKFGVRYEFGTE